MAQAKKKSESIRRSMISLRMSGEDRDVIDRAAEMAGKSRTDFMVEASRRAAHETLLGTNLVVVDGRNFKRFMKLFNAPSRPNERLRSLINLKALWES